MLEFFRTYQRCFMAVVAVVIIFSFSFFGTYSSMGSFEKEKDFVVASAIDGSDMRYSEIRELSQLLELDGPSQLFQTTFLKTGLGERLYSAYYEALKGEWSSRLAKARACRFYSHPAFKHLDAKQVWSHLVPNLLDEIDTLQQYEEEDPRFFSQWAKVYSLQESIAPEMVRRILLYQQNQEGAPPDDRLLHGDFSLFGCRTLRDWFGTDLLHLASQFLLNGAALANQQGYQVSMQEARADLKGRLNQTGLSQNDVGVLTNRVLPTWKKILGFLRWFEEVGQSALIDPLSFQKVHEFAGQKAEMDLYSLPQELQFSAVEDFLAYETYCFFACQKPRDAFSFPREYLPISSVKKAAPELTASVYRIRFTQVDPMELAGAFSLREVWDWQIQDASWSGLCERFPQIEPLAEPAKRFAVLEKLDSALRRKVDEWSRIAMVRKDVPFIEKRLRNGEKRDALLTFTNQQVKEIPIQNAERFEKLLLQASESDPEALSALQFYQESDRGPYLSVDQVELVEKDSIVSFKEARERGQIPIERFLQERYDCIKGRYRREFQTGDGQWKPLKEVREQAIRKIFSELFQQMDEREKEGQWERGKGPLEFYVSHRFSELMRRALSAFQSNEQIEPGIWRLQKQDLVIERSKSEEWMQKEPFLVSVDSWSPIYMPSDGNIAFFYLKNREIPQEPILDRIHFGKERLSLEAQRCFADELLELALQKQALVLPLRTEGEEHDDL